MNNTTIIETLGDIATAIMGSLHTEVFQLLSFVHVMFDSSFDNFHKLLGLCTIWYYHLVLGRNDLFEFLIYFNISVQIYNLVKTYYEFKNAPIIEEQKDGFFRNSCLKTKCFDEEKSTLDEESNLSNSSSRTVSSSKTKTSNDGTDGYEDDKFEDIESVDEVGVHTEEVKRDGGGNYAVSFLVVDDENEQSEQSDSESEISETKSETSIEEEEEEDVEDEPEPSNNYAVGQ